MKKTFLCRMPNGTTATLTMKAANEIIQSKGLDPAGDVQQFHTMNVLRRLKKFMPFLSGVLYKITQIQTDIQRPEIVTEAPQAEYLFEGKKMVNAATGKGPALIPGVGYRYKKGTVLKVTDQNLVYTKTKNPMAGPHWDRTLSAAEGPAMAADAQRYINRKG